MLYLSESQLKFLEPNLVFLGRSEPRIHLTLYLEEPKFSAKPTYKIWRTKWVVEGVLRSCNHGFLCSFDNLAIESFDWLSVRQNAKLNFILFEVQIYETECQNWHL